MVTVQALLFTPRPLHSAAKAVRTCKFSQEGIQSFAKGELSMDWMPLLFAAQPVFGWGVNSNVQAGLRIYCAARMKI